MLRALFASHGPLAARSAVLALYHSRVQPDKAPQKKHACMHAHTHAQTHKCKHTCDIISIAPMGVAFVCVWVPLAHMRIHVSACVCVRVRACAYACACTCAAAISAKQMNGGHPSSLSLHHTSIM